MDYKQRQTDESNMEKGKASTVSLNEVLGLLDIPSTTHEFATLLQFGTSYEVVDCLTKRLQIASKLFEQEHKDRETEDHAW